MASPLVIAVSPYHLTTREAPAMAALQIADEVVTMLPAPESGRSREDVERAVGKSPRYLRLMESWRWTMPLWREGILASSHEDVQMAEDLRSYYGRIAEEDEYQGLRSLTRHAAAANADQFLDLLSSDILKGGPDPGLNIPVMAAIDEFAAQRGLVVARAAATSIAQRAEARLAQRIFAFPLPVLLRASARLIMTARRELRDELKPLRRAIADVCQGACGSEGRAGTDESIGTLTRAAQAYTAAFAEFRDRVEGRDDDQGIRVVSGFVGMSGAVVPADIAMRSGLAAARAMNARGATASSRGGGAPRAGTTPARLVAIVVKELNVQPD